MTPLLIGLGGGLGALARWGVASVFPKAENGFPLGITIVNVLGSFALGLVVGLVSSNGTLSATEPVTVGLLGGFTTFSTWMVDIEEAPNPRMRMATTVVPLILGLLAASAGILITLAF